MKTLQYLLEAHGVTQFISGENCEINAPPSGEISECLSEQKCNHR